MTEVIHPLDPKETPRESLSILKEIEKSMGGRPNVFRAMAHSPLVLGAMWSWYQTRSKSSIPEELREGIALRVAQLMESDYCLAAHTVMGHNEGIDDHRAYEFREGTGESRKEQVALDFVSKLIESKGHDCESEIKALRDEGYTDAQIYEIIQIVSLNQFNGYCAIVSGVELDFPRVERELHAVR